MNTIQLNKILFNFPTTKDNYVGTFAIDKIPKSITYPSSMIINNEPSTRAGSHWIAIYFFKNKKAIFFDSYGQSAKSYKLNKFLKKILFLLSKTSKYYKHIHLIVVTIVFFLLYLCL